MTNEEIKPVDPKHILKCGVLFNSKGFSSKDIYIYI